MIAILLVRISHNYYYVCPLDWCLLYLNGIVSHFDYTFWRGKVCNNNKIKEWYRSRDEQVEKRVVSVEVISSIIFLYQCLTLVKKTIKLHK